MRHTTFALFQARTRRAARQFTWGGEWAVALPAVVKRNLYWFFCDGLFASACDNIVVTYLVLYILALGATKTQVGLMSAFSSLSAALLLLPGALLAERLGHRKELTMAFGGGMARLALLALAFLPVMVGGQTLVWAAIALSVMRDSFSNLGFPAWMSLAGDVVPMEGRGRYFGSRNFIMGVAGILAILLVGELITHTSQPLDIKLRSGWRLYWAASRLSVSATCMTLTAVPARRATPAHSRCPKFCAILKPCQRSFRSAW